MAAPVTLIPLVCARCQNPISANPDEVAWVCDQCGQGLLLSEEKGTQPLEIHFSAALKPGQKGRPFWIASGSANLQRQVYGGGDRSNEARQFWSAPRKFVIPAYTCGLDQAVQIGQQLLTQPPVLQEGPPAAFEPASLMPDDVRAYADFVVMAIEASRSDKLKELQFKLDLEKPVLWILP